MLRGSLSGIGGSIPPILIAAKTPINDALFPDGCIYESRSPHVADTTIYNARQSGITFDCNSPGLARVVSSSYIAEGASGTISLLNHVGSSSFYNAGIAFSRYYAGYSWAESAYMAIPRLGTHYTVLGDPLMAPFAAKPTVSFLPPTPADGSNVSGQVALAADAEPDGTGSIGRVEFYVVGTNQNPKLVGTDNDAPYFTSWDTTENFADGEYTILAVAYQLNERPRSQCWISESGVSDRVSGGSETPNWFQIVNTLTAAHIGATLRAEA